VAIQVSPGFLSVDLWSKHEAFYRKAFLRALELLRSTPSLPLDEIDLNRELYACLLKANRELDPDGSYPPPLVECCNQPDFDDPSRSPREHKRPDFTWGFVDPHESDYLKSAKQFIVECKRIGKSQRPKWNLNRNYVDNGIVRFIDPSWAYAQRFPCAMMIAYWQSMEWDQILTEINQFAKDRDVPPLRLIGEESKANLISRLQHFLIRSFPVSPFRLDHLWVDVRAIPMSKAGIKKKKKHPSISQRKIRKAKKK
jgi:hypothetical protein